VPFDNLTNQVKHNIENFLNIENNFFNGCLLNLYEDGSASISPHKDDEKDMDLTAPIVVLSIGETRTFILQNDITKEKLKLKIGNGDILIMYPLCQKEWVHSIPKEKEIIKPRISLTFRKFN
jgi:alkylated DNA repair dioxygenase AlkB